ncbi:MAG: acetylglutamate kinase [Capnocytophaga sp.]|nr:acetylglutamate kinase [Capnocytophaga sp.]
MILTIVKIGGNVIDNPEELANFLKNFVALPSPKILVHGGGKIASELSKTMGIEPQFVNGRRITDAATLDIAVMVYGGLLNKKIVASLQSLGCNAVGLSGADAGVVRSGKRPSEPVDFGFVGDVREVANTMLHSLLELSLTPVFCALTHDGQGQLLNTNADTMASEIAIALGALYEVHLYYCFEKQGVLQDVNDENSLITHIDSERYQSLLDQKIIADGMLPKLENCFRSLQKGVAQVHIGNPQMITTNVKHTTISL